MRRSRLKSIGIGNKWVGIVSLGILALVIAVAFVVPVLPLDFSKLQEIHMDEALRPPTFKHLFGTDAFGREVLLRVIFGSRPSLMVGLITVILTTIIGTIAGLLAGFYKVLDNLIMRIVDVSMALPSMLLALAFLAIFGPSMFGVIASLTIVYSSRTARIVRGEVLRVKELTYVEAATAIGTSRMRILFLHILLNSCSPLIVQATYVLAQAILLEAGLSFLGVGIPPPMPSWGNIMSDGREVLVDAPWVTLFPGITLALVVLSNNLLGDMLRDALDPYYGTKSGR